MRRTWSTSPARDRAPVNNRVIFLDVVSLTSCCSSSTEWRHRMRSKTRELRGMPFRRSDGMVEDGPETTNERNMCQHMSLFSFDKQPTGDRNSS